MSLWGEIGSAAGAAYGVLEAEGKQVTFGSLKKKTKLDDVMLALALGWLAREDKVALDKKGRTISACLK